MDERWQHRRRRIGRSQSLACMRAGISIGVSRVGQASREGGDSRTLYSNSSGGGRKCAPSSTALRGKKPQCSAALPGSPHANRQRNLGFLNRHVGKLLTTFQPENRIRGGFSGESNSPPRRRDPFSLTHPTLFPQAGIPIRPGMFYPHRAKLRQDLT